MKPNHSILRFAEKAIDFLINMIAIYLGYLAADLQYTELFMANVNGLVLTSFLVGVISIFAYSYSGVYRPSRAERTTFYVGRLLTVNFTLFCLYLTFSAIFFSHYRFYLFWGITTFLLSSVVLGIKKIVMMSVLDRIRTSKRNIKTVLLLTDSQEMTDEYMREIHLNPNFGYNVIGYVGNTAIEGVSHLGTTGELDAILRKTQPDEVVMAFETVRRATITKYVAICNDNGIKVLAIPAICGFFKSQRQVKNIGMLPMIDIRSNPLDHFTARFLKRTTDIVLSFLLILLSSPLMLFTAIGVKLSSPGPVLFRQERVGRNNRVFTIYKFRSMRVNDEQSSGWTTDHDPRKTRFGNFIRKYSIDELPQLFNVLKGDMSLVGPRPEMVHYVEQFRKSIPLYMLKHSVRPGITGLAQIDGLRGDTSIDRRIEEDIHYIEHWTWLYDIKIILLTPFKMLNRHEKRPKDVPASQKTDK